MKKATRLLAPALALVTVFALCACGREGPEATSTPAPPPATTPENTAELSPTQVPEGETKDFTLSLEGMEETVSMTYVEFGRDTDDEFYKWSGPAGGIYLDLGRYGCHMFEGDIYVSPTAAGEYTDSGLLIAWLGQGSADIYAQEALTAAPPWNSATDCGMADMAGTRAYCVERSSDESYQCIYFVPVGDGTLALTVSVPPEAAEGNLPRLILSALSLELK